MTIKCPHCGAYLTYSIESAVMECSYCNSEFRIEDVKEDQPGEMPVWKVPQEISQAEQEKEESDEPQEMNFKIFSCASCGAELMINETESATFCGYCGQPTLVNERISKKMRPKFIIPFKIERERAEQIVRSNFGKGFFLPKNVKEFEVEKLHGVYIPYLLADVYCQDAMGILSSLSVAWYIEAYHKFHGMSVDLSKLLNDETSARIEPYLTSDMVKFNPAYRSGFYADCANLTKEEQEETVLNKTKDQFQGHILKSIKGFDKRILSTSWYGEMESSEYVLFPAWFLSFWVKKKLYTVVINGQTGKCVGAVPYSKKKLVLVVAACSLILAPLTSLLCYLWMTSDNWIVTEIGFYAYVPLAAILWIIGCLKLDKMKKSRNLTVDTALMQYANDRQEG